MKNLVILASGNGTNAKAIINHFRYTPNVKIACIITNNPKAGVITIAQDFQIPWYLINRKDMYESDHVVNLLKNAAPDLIILAGFLWLLPQNILMTFPHKIINIHPALLPKYGGKGMYGMKVHEAVIENQEKETGITIHYLNEQYDDGEIILQKSYPVTKDDNAETIAAKVHLLEHEWYPKVIEDILKEN
jgi:phosphoribosylglycinamide formyltransferase-1